jgi:chromosome segregation ATPase
MDIPFIPFSYINPDQTSEDNMTTNQEVQDMIEKFTGMLGHVRDTFIRGSELEGKVTELESRVNELLTRVEHYNGQIGALDEALSNVRRERDEAQAALANEQQQHNTLRADHEYVSAEYNRVTNAYNDTLGQVEALRRERDDALMEVRRLSDQLNELRSKHDKLREHVEGLWRSLSPQPRTEGGQFDEFPKAQGW